MQIAYIGNFGPEYSTENDVKKAFEYLGHEVIALQENKPFDINFNNIDLLLITSTWDDAIDLTEWINVMYMCAKNNVPTATLHLDTFWGKSRGNRHWWMNPMFQTAYIFTADGDYEKEWKAFGKNHIWLPPAIRHDATYYGDFSLSYECDVAFAGSNGIGYHEDVWPYRKEVVDAVRAMCKKNQWSFKNPGGDDPKINRDSDMNNFYASARVTIGDSLCLKHSKAKYWSDRVPEATGRYGFLIMPQIDEVEKIWPSIPMYEWGNWDDLEKKIATYLDDEIGRESIKELNARETKKNHTYVNRVQTILKTVGLE